VLLQYEFTWQLLARFPHGALQCQVLSEQELGQCVRREKIVSGYVTGRKCKPELPDHLQPLLVAAVLTTHLPSQGIPAGCTGIELTSHIDHMLRPYRSGLDEKNVDVE